MGKPSRWNKIPNILGDYEVSDIGQVRNVKTNRLLKPQFTGQKRKQYLAVSLPTAPYGGFYFHKIHRLVAEAFIGSIPKDKMVCHIDGDVLNNKVENLYIGTNTENSRDRSGHGNTFGKKLTDEQKQEIIRRRNEGELGKDLAKEFSISPQRVCDIYRGRP